MLIGSGGCLMVCISTAKQVCLQIDCKFQCVSVQHYRTLTPRKWRSAPQIAAAVRLINRSDDEFIVVEFIPPEGLALIILCLNQHI